MLKHFLLAVGLLAAMSVAALAAGLSGTVVALDGKHVQLTVAGERPAWIRKGATIRVEGISAKITRVAGDTLDVVTAKAPKAKPGDAVPIAPAPKSTSGC